MTHLDSLYLTFQVDACRTDDRTDYTNKLGIVDSTAGKDLAPASCVFQSC